MNPLVVQLALEVIRGANRQNPADARLRRRLAVGRLAQDLKTQASRAVFAYYRWLGWLGGKPPDSVQIERGLQLADRFAAQPAAFSDEELVARAVPSWIADEMPVAPGWVRAIQAEPKLWLRARVGQGKALAKKLGHARALVLPDAVLYEGQENLFARAEFRAGEFEIQDLASQMIGHLCAAKPGETWWDACAGEGGKLLHLSDLMENRGLIWASDRALWRLQTLRRRAARAKVFNYRTVPWDGGPKLPTKTKFDGVLVDAPCSGVGTWQRNPHARWTTTPQDVRELALVQQALLAHASAAVKPGGRLIYAACSLTRAESTDVVEAFNRLHPGFEPLVLALPLPSNQKRLPGEAVGVTLRPQDWGANGMFTAAWRRRP